MIVAVFVGINIGGSSAGVSFGPATGSDIISVRKACILMSFFALLGGVLVGPRVVDTMGRGIVPGDSFTLAASITVLFFTGASILIGNLMNISSSTSQIAVGAIIGMGIAAGNLDYAVIGRIFMWWLLSAVIAFWISAVIGRYLYDRTVEFLKNQTSEKIRAGLVIIVGCYMAFSAGSSNVANAIAPLVGSGSVQTVPAVLMACASIAVGVFTFGPKIMKAIGGDITDLPLEASLLVMTVAASLITLLSVTGIPASLSVIATLSIIGLGWGRATQRVPIERELGVKELREKDERRMKEDEMNLYKPQITAKMFMVWTGTPILAGLLAYPVFLFIL